MTREEFIKQRCEIDKITEEEFEKRYRVVKCNCGQPYCKGYRCLDLNDLLEENQELNQKYLNAVSDYETTMAEKEQLKRQVEDKILLEMKLENELFNKRKEYQETYKDVRIEIKEYKTQQQEFIKFLEDNYESTQDIWYIKILQKYKSIIGDDK